MRTLNIHAYSRLYPDWRWISTVNDRVDLISLISNWNNLVWPAYAHHTSFFQQHERVYSPISSMDGLTGLREGGGINLAPFFWTDTIRYTNSSIRELSNIDPGLKDASESILFAISSRVFISFGNSFFRALSFILHSRGSLTLIYRHKMPRYELL